MPKAIASKWQSQDSKPSSLVPEYKLKLCRSLARIHSPVEELSARINSKGKARGLQLKRREIREERYRPPCIQGTNLAQLGQAQLRPHLITQGTDSSLNLKRPSPAFWNLPLYSHLLQEALRERETGRRPSLSFNGEIDTASQVSWETGVGWVGSASETKRMKTGRGEPLPWRSSQPPTQSPGLTQ